MLYLGQDNLGYRLGNERPESSSMEKGSGGSS